MAIQYGRKKYRQHYVLYTMVTAVLLCAVFVTMVGALYRTARADAHENLHEQTKQIKDDIILQLTSDRENLATMANFAAKLYADGEDYSLLFESFKPIGLIENIGILQPNGVFVTKAGSMDLTDKISFLEESQKDAYISGRVADLTREGHDLIRSAVPIRVGGKTVGVLYGVITLEKIGQRYNAMAQQFDAQLFVYSSDTGNLVIDTVHEELGNISFLQDRVFLDGSYEEMVSTDKGFLSFESAYRDENMHLHYSTIEQFGWMIAMARYDSQVYAEVAALTHMLGIVFVVMAAIIAAFVLKLMRGEKKSAAVTACASDVRKTLLETTGDRDQISEALKQVCRFAQARSAVFFNTDGDDYFYITGRSKTALLEGEDRIFFQGRLLRYAAEYFKVTGSAVNLFCITPNRHLQQTDEEFFRFLQKKKINEISYSATTTTTKTTVLAVLNAKRGQQARRLAEKISACFSMAISNRKHLLQTQKDATTDGLTGVWNRVAFKQDLADLNAQKARDFSCVYVDVNELHTVNNKLGHTAGDEMLVCVANTLKELFFGHKVYRMGGDEFVVLCQETEQKAVEDGIALLISKLDVHGYHVAVGLSYRTRNTDTEEMVKEAEARMYEAKAQYYQDKAQANLPAAQEVVLTETGIGEIDTMLSVLKENYHGIYSVNLATDKAHRILMPAYLGYHEDEEHFSQLYTAYVADNVDPEHRRAVTGFLNYDAIRRMLSEGQTPKITYKKTDGQRVVLSVYPLHGTDAAEGDTLWVFAKQ